MSQLHDLTALEAAAAVRRREVSPVELVEHALDRIARLDEQVAAFVTVTAERARSQARAAEAAVLAADDPAKLPPLLGVPTAIKDLNMVAGVPADRAGQRRRRLDPHPGQRLRAGGPEDLGATRFAEALGLLNVHARRGIAASAHLDAVLTPTLAMPARPVGWFQQPDGDPAADFERQKRFTPFTAIYNTTGQPAISLPLYETHAGLPIGIMLVGRPGGEAPLLTLAAQLEAALPWLERRPPIWTR